MLPSSLPGGLDEKEAFSTIFLKMSTSHQHCVSSFLGLLFLLSAFYFPKCYVFIKHIVFLSPTLKYMLCGGREFCCFALYFILGAWNSI